MASSLTPRRKWKLHREPLNPTMAIGLPVALAVAFFAYRSLTVPVPATPAAAPAPARLYTTSKGYWAAKSPEALAVVTDGPPKRLAQLRQTGEIFPLEPGLSVKWLETAGYLGNRVHVQIKDMDQRFWVPKGALK